MINIILRPLTVYDTSNIIRWRNNEFVRKNLYNQEIITEDEHLRYFKKYIETNIIKQYVITVDNKGQKSDIGTVFFKNIDSVNKKCEVGIFIGEKSFLGGGYGTSALKTAVEVVFKELNLNKVYATIMENNIASRRIFAKIGFVESGLLLEDYFGKNGFENIVLVEMTKKMWENLGK